MKNATFFLALFLCYPFSSFLYSQCVNDQNLVNPFFHDNKLYEVIRIAITWDQAAACAVERGGHLVQIDDPLEQNVVFNELNAAILSFMYVGTIANDGGGIPYVWIGANDIDNEGTWNWHGSNTTFWTGEG